MCTESAASAHVFPINQSSEKGKQELASPPVRKANREWHQNGEDETLFCFSVS